MRAMVPQNMACTGSDEFDVLQILFQPAADARPQLVEVFQNDRALGFLVKGKNGVPAEFLHGAAQLPAGFGWHQVTVKGFSGQRSGDRAIRTDEPEIESKLLGDGQGKLMTPPGDQHNFNARGVRPAQGSKIAVRDMKLGVEQGAVDIGRQQPDGRLRSLHH